MKTRDMARLAGISDTVTDQQLYAFSDLLVMQDRLKQSLESRASREFRLARVENELKQARSETAQAHSFTHQIWNHLRQMGIDLPPLKRRRKPQVQDIESKMTQPTTTTKETQ